MPPVLHRDAEDRRYRRARGQVPSQVRHGLNTTAPRALLAALTIALPLAAVGAACPSPRSDETVVSATVLDGDTLVLGDRRHVRLIGINAPEIAHRERPGEPFGERAHAALAALAPPGTALRLRLGQQTHDRYRRLLAHVFLADGTNLQAEMLARGLALTLAIPPNLWAGGCYDRQEARARATHRGLWADPWFAPVAAARLDPATRGFRLLRGTVSRIGRSRANLWLQLAPDVAARIPRADLHWFGDFDPATLAGRRVEVRGWIQRRRGESRVTLRHPRALRLLD